MGFPCRNALGMEIFFARRAILQSFSLLVHFGETNNTIGVILQINILRIFGWLFHPAFEATGELLIEESVGILGYLLILFEVVEELIILPHLRDDEVDVLAGDFLKPEIHASAVHCCGDVHVILASCCLH